MSLICCILISTLAQQSSIDLKSQTTITRSGRVIKGEYSLPVRAGYNELGDGSIAIKGDGLVVDFQGAVVRGTVPTVEPDQRAGTGIFVTGKNITVLNAKVHGYKIGLQARNAPGLKLINCDFSYNWKQHLASTRDKEDLSDWMSYHQNEKDEWLRYGASIYLRKCDGFEVKGCTAVGGQNGLMVMESNRGKIWNNNFSFLSGIGLGMYRSSENRIMHNKIDWCIRGFSYGVYNRGQDSAGILIYEQSNKNIFAYNSVTHGGDGFFLWAGQSTMDTGKGGCNDNLLFGNDFSHAPTNGIEATFSRNVFANNLILECWHGIWGGYSYDSKVLGNQFGFNAEGIAWEHGQGNLVAGNSFFRDNEGINIWSNPNQDPNWGYPKNRDTRSRDWTIQNNTFSSEFTNGIRVRRTQGVEIFGNLFERVPTPIKQEAEVTALNAHDNRTVTGAPLPPASSLNQGDVSDYASRFTVPWLPNPAMKAPWNSGQAKVAREAQSFNVSPMPGGMTPFLKKDQLRGWRYMLVDEWGPYDFKSPLIWPREATALGGGVAIDSNGKQITGEPSKTQRFEILGPKGRWKLISKTGYTSVSAPEGVVPGFVEATIVGKQPSQTELVLEYVGEKTTNYKGIVTPAGKPVRFSHREFRIPIDWTVKFYRWQNQVDPKVATSIPVEADLQKIFAGDPIKTLQLDKLDFASGGAFAAGLPNDRFATVAEGDLTIEPGNYVFELTTDDGARLWLDGQEIIKGAWKYQGPTQYTAEVRLGGKHHLRLEHFEIDGYAALKVNIRPK